MSSYPVAIIGAGPSGLAAAIQLKRQGVDCVVFEKSQPGGLLKNANLIENYPGFPRGIKGPELVSLILKQAEANQVTIKHDEIISLDFDNDKFRLTTANYEYTARIVMIASGTRPKPMPGLVIPDSCRNRVHYEVFPLAKVADSSIAVIGAGDAAFDYSLNLAERNNRIMIFNRTARSAALDLLKQRVDKHPAIIYRTNITLESVLPDTNDSLRLTFKEQGHAIEIEADYLLIAIGREPAINFLKPDLQSRLSHLQAERRLYIVGDVNAGIYRQTSIATGEAVKAAMIIQKSLEDLS